MPRGFVVILESVLPLAGMRRAARLGFAAAIGLAILPAAAQPTNDVCGGAVPISLNTIYTVNTTNATSTGDPTNFCTATFGKGVWFSYTPGRSGLITLSTCGSDFDTLIEVYSGACDALNFVACGDDSGPACPGVAASLTFLAAADVTYYIVAGGYQGASGNLQLRATAPPPLNDLCLAAAPMSEGVSYSMNTVNATEIGDPVSLCQTNFGRGVWYSFTPSKSGIVSVSTCGSDFDTVLQVFSGTCGSLTPVTDGSNDDGGPDCNSTTASVHFRGVAGVTYSILSGGYDVTGGKLVIAANVLPELGLRLTGGKAVLSWPTNFPEFALESATNLSQPTYWDPVIGATQVWGGKYFVTNLMVGDSTFYRLKK